LKQMGELRLPVRPVVRPVRGENCRRVGPSPTRVATCLCDRSTIGAKTPNNLPKNNTSTFEPRLAAASFTVFHFAARNKRTRPFAARNTTHEVCLLHLHSSHDVPLLLRVPLLGGRACLADCVLACTKGIYVAVTCPFICARYHCVSQAVNTGTATTTKS